MKTKQFERGATQSAIVARIATTRKDLHQAIQDLENRLETLEREAQGGHAVDYAVVEKEIREHTCAIERGAHAHLLQAQEVDAPLVLIQGRRYTRIGHALGTYNTLAGPVEIPRALYREAGRRNSRTVDAISLRTGAIGRGWLPRTAATMAFWMQQGTSREAVKAAEQSGLLPYSRASFERVAGLTGKEYLEHQADLEDLTIQVLEIPGETHALSVGLDRVSIPLEEPVPRKPGRPPKGAPKRPIQRVFKMAYCGTVTLHDATGEAIHTFRYGTMPDMDPLFLCWRMANDVQRIMARKPGLRLALLADGSHEMWDLLEKHFVQDPIFGNPHRLVDYWHLVEKLNPAAKVIYGDEKGQAMMKKWRNRLLTRQNAAGKILDSLQKSRCEPIEVGDKKPVHEAMTYLKTHFVEGSRMDYATARKWKLPIGSGNTEATCKTLVEVRMKRAGSRWKQETGEYILQLRALALSDRWEMAINLLQGYNRTSVRPAA